MQFQSFNLKEIEPAILEFWHNKKIVDKLRERNKDKEKFYFLEGPPYTSGKVHIGTAYQTSLKDVVLRYKRMQQKDVWDRMGYDMHGLPTAQKVMKKLDLKNKEDIEAFGLANFTKECEEFCLDMMKQMNEDFIRLGITMDFSNPYQPVTNNFMEGVWYLIKKAYEKGRLYEGLRTMHWDAATQTAVAKHELEYKQVTDTSIFVKFPHAQKENTFFVIWTTTPWTIPLNLAIMANPQVTYVEAQVDNETWIIAKELAQNLIETTLEKELKITKEFAGSEIVGQHYTHPLGIKEHLPKELQDNPKLFSVLESAEHVTTESGTGLVHCAPGCGPEDYEVGHQNKIPPFNCVNEAGVFENLGKFTNLRAKLDDDKFIEHIENADMLVAKQRYVHDYPHGERSHEPVIFRTTKQWFFKVEDIKEKMIEANEHINWNPIAAKNAFRSWLENLRDNSITKQRFWGTPLPVWQADDGEVIVVGSIKELEELANKKVTNLHKPHIDEITIEKDGKTYKRIPDILDVWVDAGSVSWNCLNFPQQKKDFERYFPADFILEGKDQVRGWFNLLMVASFLAFDKPAFKNVYMNGFVNDIDGVKMSKSLGNIISPKELLEKHGADVLRYYMFQTNAGIDLNFSWNECALKERNLNILWNVHKLLLNMCKEQNINPTQLDKDLLTQLESTKEQYIFSKLHSTIQKVTQLLDAYRLDEAIAPIEELYLELSRTYIKQSREQAAMGSREEKELIILTVHEVLLETLKMLSTIAPFTTEAIYLNLKDAFGYQEESISHSLWPQANEHFINEELEQAVEETKQLVQAALYAREKARLGMRWPVKELIIESKHKLTLKAATLLRDDIKAQVNAKTITLVEEFPQVKLDVKPNRAALGKAFGKEAPKIIEELQALDAKDIIEAFAKNGSWQVGQAKVTPAMLNIEREVPKVFTFAESRNAQVYLNTERSQELELEGYARELTRNVQALRKDAGMNKTQNIALHIKVPEELEGLEKHKESIAQKVGAPHCIINTQKAPKKHEHEKEVKVKEQSFTISLSLE